MNLITLVKNLLYYHWINIYDANGNQIYSDYGQNIMLLTSIYLHLNVDYIDIDYYTRDYCMFNIYLH